VRPRVHGALRARHTPPQPGVANCPNLTTVVGEAALGAGHDLERIGSEMVVSFGFAPIDLSLRQQAALMRYCREDYPNPVSLADDYGRLSGVPSFMLEPVGTSHLCHVWTAPDWQGLSSRRRRLRWRA
jgi:hypothetical protein